MLFSSEPLLQEHACCISGTARPECSCASATMAPASPHSSSPVVSACRGMLAALDKLRALIACALSAATLLLLFLLRSLAEHIMLYDWSTKNLEAMKRQVCPRA